MDWLMYIFGGLLLFYWHSYFLNNTDGKLENKSQAICFLLLLIAPIMVWIWICWKFIR